MSNVAIVARCLDAINTRDTALMKELSAPDISIRPLRAMLEDTTYRGYDGIDQWLRDISESWVELRIEVHGIEERAADCVAALVTLHGRGHGSQAATDMRVELVAKLRDGLVTDASVVAP